MSETAEESLLKILQEIAERKGPGFYAVRDIADLLKFQLGEDWINETSTGRMLMRLGFTEKRRVRGTTQYRLTTQKLNLASEKVRKVR